MTDDNLAVVRAGATTFALESSPCREPRGDEVLFAVQHAAICGTDRQIARGVRDDRARILGHEGVVAVARAGEGATSWPVGARYVCNPVNAADQDEILGHSTDGLFQRCFAIRAGELERRGLVVAVPHGIASDRCVLAEPLATVVYTHELLDTVGRPRSLLVLGAGSVGLLHVLYARRVLGLPHVGIVCPRRERAERLRRRGLLPSPIHVFDGESAEQIVSAMPAIGAVLACVPARATEPVLRLATEVVAAHGCIGLIGGVDRRSVHQLPGVDLAAVRRANSCGVAARASFVAVTAANGKPVRVFGQRGSAVRHVLASLHVLGNDPLFGRILTHRITLPALPEVLALLAAGSSLLGREYVKGLVDCTALHASVAAIDDEGAP